MSTKRNETGFRNVCSKDGRFSPHLSSKTTERINKYCRASNSNRTKVVEECINLHLDILEREMLASMSKEELIELYLNK